MSRAPIIATALRATDRRKTEQFVKILTPASILRRTIVTSTRRHVATSAAVILAIAEKVSRRSLALNQCVKTRTNALLTLTTAVPSPTVSTLSAPSTVPAKLGSRELGKFVQRRAAVTGLTRKSARPTPIVWRLSARR